MSDSARQALKHPLVSGTATLVIALGCIGTIDAASAEEAAEKAGGLEEIIVTAQRRSERLQDVPLSISAQTAEDLELAGITNIQDVSMRVPGLTFGTTGAWAFPTIRGVSTGVTGIGAESPIAIYVDGAYRSNPVGNLFDLPDLTRLEVLRGPQGTLFGRNATGGAISVYTRDPEPELTGNFGVSAGYFSGGDIKESLQTTYKGFVSVPLIEGVLAASLSGYYQDTEGYLTDDVTGDDTGSGDNQLYRAKLLFTPNSAVRVVLSGTYGELEEGIHSTATAIDQRSIAGATVGPPAGPRGAPYSPVVIPSKPWHIADELEGGGFTKSEEYTLGLKGEFTLQDLGTLTSTTSYADVKPEVLSNTDGAYAPGCLAVHQCNEFYATQFTKTFQQELTFASEQFGAFDFIGGVFYLHDKGTALRNVDAPGVPAPGTDLTVPGVFYDDFDAKTEAYAVFGELGWQAAERLKVIAGIRYSKEDRSLSRFAIRLTAAGPTTLPFVSADADFDAWTPRLSLRYDISDELNVYATYSRGFKSGLIPTSNPAGDPLDPETIDSYEVGAKFGTSAYSLNVAAFYADYQDLQAQFFTGAATIAQSASAEIYGAEVDGSAWFGNFELSAAISYLPKAEYTKYPGASYFAYNPTTRTVTNSSTDAAGLRLLKTPEMAASVTGTYSWDLAADRRLQLSGTAFHSDDYNWDVVGRIKTDAYTLFNAQIALLPASGTGLKVSLWGRNLANEEYLSGTIISAAGDGGIYGSPRQVGLSLDYSF